jgi:phosphodiesterase/alkaline phosphatase D-like protein
MPRLLIGPLLRHVGEQDATVWVETDAPCVVEIQAGSVRAHEQTWSVAGHHYALVCVDGLAPGARVPYEVSLDGEQAWPPAGDDRPPPIIRTLGGERPVRVAFGSCRYGRASTVAGDRHFQPDALKCLARALLQGTEDDRPDALLMVGDQVYADETSPATQRRIRARRDPDDPNGPGAQVADFEEYTWLYLESWTDPDVRWLLATVPTSMIFDDHDVRDDWNTSHAWRADMQRTGWWEDRIIGGLSSYWVYQHLGNLSAAELAADELYQRVRTLGADAEALLRSFAAAADREADGAKGARWSYRRDLGRVRLVVVDSRCGRILADGARSMLSEDEFQWVEQQLTGDYDHLLLATSLPWLLARALHDIEAWDEVLANGARGRTLARWAEKLRRAADLEHWAAFRRSFDWLADRLREVADGRRRTAPGPPPASVLVLSGDVHHSYVARVDYGVETVAPVYQVTCSPLHNYVPRAMQAAFRLGWSAAAERTTRVLLGLAAHVPSQPLTWRRVDGPWFGNAVATLRFTGRRAELLMQGSAPAGSADPLVDLARLVLA